MKKILSEILGIFKEVYEEILRISSKQKTTLERLLKPKKEARGTNKEGNDIPLPVAFSLMAVTIISVVIFSFNANSKKTNHNEYRVEDKTEDSIFYTIDIPVQAHSFVERALKSPSTAKFPHYSGHKIEDLGKGTYQVSSYVDSQNGFGAMIRTFYKLKMKEKSKDNWELLDIEFF